MKFFLQLCCALAMLCPAALARRCAQAADVLSRVPSKASAETSSDGALSCPRVWPGRGGGASAASGAMAGSGPGRELAYQFDLAAAGSDPGRVRVTLDLRVPASGTELIALPSEWAELTGLERGIEHLEVTGGRARLAAGPTPSLRVLRATAGARVQLTYDLVGDRGRASGATERHRVLLRPGLVEFNGDNGLVAPAMDAAEPVHVTMRFSGLPATQTMVTSFGAGPAQEMTGAWREVRGALFAGGALRTRELVVEGAPVLLAIVPPAAGEWQFSDEEAAAKVRQILGAERMFWRDLAIPWYAVVLAPLEQTGMETRAAGAAVGGGGTAFTHAFLLSLAPREGFGTETQSLFAHEAFHEWNPLGMGSAGATPAPAWFTEGVTTFYQDRVLERARLLDADEYLRRVNRIVRDDRFLRDARREQARLRPQAPQTGSGPAREEVAALEAGAAALAGPGSQDGRETGETGPRALPAGQMAKPRALPGGPAAGAARLDAEATTYRAPYLRGALMAMWLDAEIRRQTRGARSLDDLMLALRADRDQPLTSARVLHTAGYFVDAATVERLREFANGDGAVPVEANGLAASLGRCVEVRERALWSFDLGMDAAELRHGAVLGSVREGSAAWRAGLRNGQTLEGWEMVTGDADHEVVMMVHGPGGRQEVHYLPRGEEVRVPQLQLAASCAAGTKTF